MTTEGCFHIQVLKSEFAKRKRFNPQYSMRAFAHSLEMNNGTLNSVLSGRRNIPIGSIKSIIEKLLLSPAKTQQFIKSQNFKGQRLIKLQMELESINQDTIINDSTENQYNILARWEHYAILSLTEVSDFQSNDIWISKKLGIDIQIARDSIQRLIEEKLLAYDENNNLFCTVTRLNTSNEVVSKALKESHFEELELAKGKLEKLPHERRHFCSETMAIDSKNLDKAHKLIDDFRKKMSELMDDSNKDDVYLLGIQYFPLTQ